MRHFFWILLPFFCYADLYLPLNGHLTWEAFWPYDGGKGEDNPVKMDFSQLLNLEKKLNQQIVGQPQAIQTTVNALVRYTAGLHEGHKPIATLLFFGPSGVGKTELAKQLAKDLLKTEQQLIRFDMSEFSEPHTIMRLIGAPPSYVGYEEGGQLTEKVKKWRTALILLDEFEKAHPKIHKLFLQVLDEGHLTDSKGEKIDFSECILIMTSNVGSANILSQQLKGASYDVILRDFHPLAIHAFTPELYNRMEPVLFNPLSAEMLQQILHNMLQDIKKSVKTKKNITLHIDTSLIDFLSSHGYKPELGARPMKRLVNRNIVDAVAYAILRKEIHSGDTVTLSYQQGMIVIKKK